MNQRHSRSDPGSSLIDTTCIPVINTDVVQRLADIANRFAAIHSELEDIARSPFGVRRHNNVPLVELMALINQTHILSDYAEALGDTIAALRAVNVALPVNPLYVMRGDHVEERQWFDDQPHESQPGMGTFDPTRSRASGVHRSAYGPPTNAGEAGDAGAEATFPPSRVRGVERGTP
jgi:hypothetical protein